MLPQSDGATAHLFMRRKRAEGSERADGAMPRRRYAFALSDFAAGE